MADEVAASTMVTYFTSCMAQLRGRAVYVQFSNHKELKTDQTHSNAVSPSGFYNGLCVWTIIDIVQAIVAIQNISVLLLVMRAALFKLLCHDGRVHLFVCHAARL
jgi:hypothetical protein